MLSIINIEGMRNQKKKTKRVGYLKVLAIWKWNRGGGSMFLPSDMIDWARQREAQGSLPPASRRKQRPTWWLWCKVGSHYDGEQMYSVVWEIEKGRFISRGQRHIWRGKSSEDQAEDGGLIATQGHGIFQAWAAARAYIWVHGPDAATVCVDVQDSWYQQRLRW